MAAFYAARPKEEKDPAALVLAAKEAQRYDDNNYVWHEICDKTPGGTRDPRWQSTEVLELYLGKMGVSTEALEVASTPTSGPWGPQADADMREHFARAAAEGAADGRGDTQEMEEGAGGMRPDPIGAEPEEPMAEPTSKAASAAGATPTVPKAKVMRPPPALQQPSLEIVHCADPRLASLLETKYYLKGIHHQRPLY